MAVADDAVTAANNPAGLTRLQRPDAVGVLSSFFTQSDWHTSIDSIDAATSDDGSNSLFIPSLYYAHPYDDKLTLGISLTVPSGLGSDPGDDTAGRYFLEEWSIGYVSLAPAAGYRINQQWSVGAAVNINYVAYDYKSAVFNGPGQADGNVKLEDSSVGFGFQLGVLYELTPATRFGLAYRSSSDTDLSDTPDFSGLTAQREASLAPVRGQELSLDTEFPQVVTAGVYHEFADGKSVTLDVGWADFSEFGLNSFKVDGTAINVQPTSYDDIWAASAGLTTPINDRWLLRFGVAYASSGVSNSNRTYALRLDRIIGAGIGTEYRWGDHRVVGLNLSYYDLGDAPITNDVPLIGTISGDYSTNYAIGIDISLRWTR